MDGWLARYSRLRRIQIFVKLPRFQRRAAALAYCNDPDHTDIALLDECQRIAHAHQRLGLVRPIAIQPDTG